MTNMEITVRRGRRCQYQYFLHKEHSRLVKRCRTAQVPLRRLPAPNVLPIRNKRLRLRDYAKSEPEPRKAPGPGYMRHRTHGRQSNAPQERDSTDAGWTMRAH